jgi:glycosyltransferase involved in cell wall biosynthesis
LETLSKDGTVNRERAVLIRGSGVHVPEYRAPDCATDTPSVLLASRMLWHKGIGAFVEAARKLKEEGVKARFILAGDSDPGNPSSIPAGQLKEWHDEGVIEWIGWQKDMDALLSRVDIACLPSTYREGIPRSLLEAAAFGRPIVTTDIPGCRDLVVDQETGFLVQPGDGHALSDALRKLISDSGLRVRMGANARSRVVDQFSEEHVIRKTLEVYEQALVAQQESPSVCKSVK